MYDEEEEENKKINKRLDEIEEMQKRISRILHFIMKRSGIIDEENNIVEKEEDLHYIS